MVVWRGREVGCVGGTVGDGAGEKVGADLGMCPNARPSSKGVGDP